MKESYNEFVPFRIFLAAGVVGLLALNSNTDEKTKEVVAEGEYTVIDASGDTVTLEKDGERYSTSINNLSQADKEKLTELRPDLKEFLNNGPINIVK